eukprot:gene34883-46862_t
MVADAGNVWSGVAVAKIIRSMSDAAILAASSALRDASIARLDVVSSGSAIWRNLIPVRSVIHSSVVSTFAARLQPSFCLHPRQILDDARGNLLTETEYSSNLSTGLADTSGGNKLTSYTYDRSGQLLSRTVNGLNTEHFVYDGLGRVVASTDVNGATTSFSFVDSATQTIVTHANGLVETNTYNKAGELLNSTDNLTPLTNLGPNLYPNYSDWGGNQTGSAGTLSNGAAAYYYTGTSSGITLGSKAIAANVGDTITWELTLKAGTTTNAALFPTGTGTDVTVTIVSGPGSVSAPPGSWAEIGGLSTTAETRIRVTRHVTTSESDYLYFLVGASTLSGTDRAGLTLIVGDPSIVKTTPAASALAPTIRYSYDDHHRLEYAVSAEQRRLDMTRRLAVECAIIRCQQVLGEGQPHGEPLELAPEPLAHAGVVLRQTPFAKSSLPQTATPKPDMVMAAGRCKIAASQ